MIYGFESNDNIPAEDLVLELVKRRVNKPPGDEEIESEREDGHRIPVETALKGG